MPDTGLLTFWLLALDFFHRSLTAETISDKEQGWIIVVGVFTGLAMFSKYQTGSLWLSAFLFVLILGGNGLKNLLFISLKSSFSPLPMVSGSTLRLE